MEEVEECIQNFYVKLEETRRHLLDQQQCRSNNSGQHPEEEDVCQLHEACNLLYAHVQNLWETAPLTLALDYNGSGGGDGNRNDSQGQGLATDNVWSVVIENCTLKAFQLVHDIFQYITMGQSCTSNNGKTKTNAEGGTLDYGVPGQTAIARMLELTIQLALESKFDDKDNTILSSTKTNGSGSHNNSNRNGLPSMIGTILEQYTAYQRQVLRLRSKPSIAHVAKIRKAAGSSNISVAELITMYQKDQESENHDGDQQAPLTTMAASNGEDEDEDEQKRFLTQPHAHAICQILGEASSLIHPLVQWHDGMIESSNTHSSLERQVQDALLQVCHDAIEILNQEAQTLAITVGNWFLVDYSSSSPACEFSPFPNVTTSNKAVDEMGFICQVISRYCSFQSNILLLSSLSSSDKQSIATQQQKQTLLLSLVGTGELGQHLQEQSLNYSTTETKLVDTNLKRALRLAKPVEIVIGSNLFVPSIVEDAYFISTRAMERASETMCDKAFWIVVHFIGELWSTSSHEGDTNLNNDNTVACNIYDALIKQIGCVVEGSVGSSNKEEMKGHGTSTSKPKSGASLFANALLNVLDKDSSKKTTIEQGAIKKAPLSGSTFQNIDCRQVQIDTLFCTLNGIHAASSACVGLSELLASLRYDNEQEQEGSTHESEEAKIQQQSNTECKRSNQDATSMVQFVEEQLMSHSLSYTTLLREQIINTISKQCGTVLDTQVPPTFIASLPSAPSLHRLYYYLSETQYHLDALAFQRAEIDERDMEMMVPLRECPFVAQVCSLKCEEGVTVCIAQNLSAQVVSLILGTLLDQKKMFTDWGSLLLAKQIRMLENFFCGIILRKQDSDVDKMHNNDAGPTNEGGTFTDDGTLNSVGATGGNTGEILHQFQKLSQAITVLQLEKPSDWAAFAYEVGDSQENNLTKHEIKKLMSLRVDFSEEAVAAVCGESSR